MLSDSELLLLTFSLNPRRARGVDIDPRFQNGIYCSCSSVRLYMIVISNLNTFCFFSVDVKIINLRLFIF